MATINPYLINTVTPYYNDNLLPYFMSFNRGTGYTGWNTVSGSGTGANDTSKFYKGDRSLYIQSTDDSSVLEINSGGTETRFTATQTKRHILQFWVNNPENGIESGDIVTVKIAKNGAGAWKELTVSATQMAGLTDTWVGFWYDFTLNSGDYLDFSFVLPANDNYPLGGSHTVYIDGFKIECDDRQVGAPAIYTQPEITLPPVPTSDGLYMYRADLGFPQYVKCIESQQVLNFGSIANNHSETIEVTVAGANDRDMVMVSIPAVAYTDGCTIHATVTASNTVKITYVNNSGGSVDPASASYKIIIFPTTP